MENCSMTQMFSAGNMVKDIPADIMDPMMDMVITAAAIMKIMNTAAAVTTSKVCRLRT